jgi:glucose/arabinose dehydrogenase
MTREAILVVLWVSFSIGHSEAADLASGQDRTYETHVVVSGLTNPWSLAFLPHGDILVTEKPGRLRVVRNDKLQSTAIAGLPPVTNLLDIAVDRDFATNSLIFISYTRNATTSDGVSQTGLELISAELRGGTLVGVTTLFRAEPKLTNLLHYGGRILVLPDGTLLLTVGDGSIDGQFAQDPSTTLGSVVRVSRNGSVPRDNPYVGKYGVRAELFSTGHRNSQGVALRPNGEVWSVEHGPQGGDELNLLMSGSNYGWPLVTSGTRHVKLKSEPTIIPRVVPPVISWSTVVAPSGMAFYAGTAFKAWSGDLLVGSLARRGLLRISLRGHPPFREVMMLEELRERIRDVRVDRKGIIYVLTDALDGRLLRIAPRQNAAPALPLVLKSRQW